MFELYRNNNFSPILACSEKNYYNLRTKDYSYLLPVTKTGMTLLYILYIYLIDASHAESSEKIMLIPLFQSK